LSATAEECERGMKELKVVLYAKFGRAINLDE
jgi:prefoldin subunit 4